MTEARPWLVVLGGINGAGKSTLAESLAEDPSLAGAVFLNPDRATSKIRAADPSKSQRAAEFGGLRAVSQEIEQLLKARRSFVTETHLAASKPRSAAKEMGGAEPPAVTRSARWRASMARLASTGPSLQ